MGFWSSAYRALLIGILAVSWTLSLVAAAGPSVISSAYTQKSLVFFDIGSDLAVMTFDFDQDIYYQKQCSPRPNDPPLEPTVIVPCCNSTLTTGCLTPSTSIGRCIDPTIQYDEEFHFPGNAAGKFAYEFQVANPDTCHSILIGSTMKYGIITVKLFRDQVNFIAGQNEMFYSGLSGSNGLFYCCSLIRGRVPGWDGKLYVRMDLTVDSKWTTQLLGSPIIPSVDYFHTNRIEIRCADGYNFTRCYSQLTGGCWPMPPALNDPAYQYVTMSAYVYLSYQRFKEDFLGLIVSRSGVMPNSEISPKRLSIGLVFNARSFSSGNASATYFIADRKVLDPANQCQVYFPYLVNKDGEPANPTPFPVEKLDTDCTSPKFSSIVEGMLTLIDDYSSFNSSSLEVAVQQYLLGLGATWQEGWTSCFSFISNQLLQKKVESTSFEDSTYCPYTNVSDPLYLNDPCCNVRQQEVACCRPRNITVDYELSVVNADAVANQCQRPKCITETLADFMTLQQSSADRMTGCTATTAKNLDSTAFSIVVQSCYATLFEIFCVKNADCRSSTRLDDSICVQGKCTVPCTDNEHCLSNQCGTAKLFNGTTVPSCVMNNLLDANNMPFDQISTHFIKCVNRTIDPVLFVYIARAVGATEISTAEEVAAALTKSIGSDQCMGFSSLLFPSIGISSDFSTQELCESSQSCNWAPCDSNTNTHCNATYCNATDMPNEFCGFCLFDQCFEVSSYPVCKYLALPTEASCTQFNGNYNPLNPFYPPKCIRSTSSGECYPPQFCAQTSGNCPATCYVPVYADATSCNGQVVGTETAAWQTWTRSNTTYGLCTVPVTTLDVCLNLSPDTRFWPGTVYAADNTYQSLLNSKVLCTAVGTCNLDLTALDINQLKSMDSNMTKFESQCTEYYCSGFNATNAVDCDNYGYCNDWTGCYMPFLEDRSIPAPCPENTLWTPKGCYVEAGVIGRPEDCIAPNEWKYVSTTREQCESLKLCTEPEIVNAVAFAPRDRAARTSNVSFKDEVECAKCGGKFEPYFEWKALAEWVPPQWRPFEWRKREMKTLNKWVPLMDYNKAVDMTYSVVARRYADILSSELLCRFGEIQSAVSSIVCDCTDKSNNCGSAAASVRDPAVGLVQICTLAEFTQTFSRGYIYAESPDIVGVLGCAPVRVGVVPISQFNSRQTITLSSVSLSSARDAQDGQERFYKNSNNIVVGEVLGDGLSIDFLGREIRGVKACIYFPDPTSSSLPDVTQFAVFSIPRGSRDLSITIKNPIDASEGQSCFDLDTSSEVYFVIALVDGWQDTDFSATLSAGEIALVAIGIILYLVVLFASVYHFAVSIATRDPTKPLLTQSRVALGLLIIFLLIRVLYLLLFVSGTFNKSQSADVIFSELPALVFLNIYCIIVLRWAALYHFGLKDGAKESFRRLKPVLYAFDALLGAAFITLLIVYFSLSDQITITCESSDIDVNSATPKQIVAIVYKAFFAVVCIILSIAFLVYGSRIIRSSTSFTVRSLDRAEQRAIKKRKQDVLDKIVITVVCTLCLLGQAANLLRASATNEPGIYILIFLYPIELLPSIMFIIILKKVPFFYRASLFARKPQIDANRNWRRSIKPNSHIASKKRNAAYGDINARLIAEEEAEDVANAVPMSETFQDESNIAFTEVKVAQEIGAGNYGKVNLGTWKGSQVALKRSKAFERTEFVREAKLVMTLPPHQNVVQTFGLTNDGFNLMVVMEYCNGSALDVKLFDLPDPISDKEKLSILIGIAQGMQHLHQNKIIHRDLAARNILINDNVPKVSVSRSYAYLGTDNILKDFGLSRKVDDVLKNSTTRNNVGPIRWMAPEALRDGAYSAKTDVWSFGVVMFEVLAQSEPHVEEDPLFIGIKIRDGAFFPRLPATSTNDQVLRNLMEQCCRKEPNERPDFNNICHVLVNRWNELYGKV